MSEDHKLADTGDYNLFSYCHNDPIDNVDPMGLAWSKTDDYNYRMAEAQWSMRWFTAGGIGIGIAGYEYQQPTGVTVGGLPSGSAQKGINDKYEKASFGDETDLNGPQFAAVTGTKDMNKQVGSADVQIYDGRYKPMSNKDLFAKETLSTKANSINSNRDFVRTDRGVIHDTLSIRLKRGYEQQSADVQSRQSYIIGFKDHKWNVHPVFEHRDRINYNKATGTYSYKHEIYPIDW
jgi:hypothetical protein